MKKLSYFIALLAILSGCAHFHDDPKTSVWAAGLWLLPLLTFIGAVIFMLSALRSSKSNSVQDTKDGRHLDNLGNMKITSLWQFWFGIVLIAATIIIVISVNVNR